MDYNCQTKRVPPVNGTDGREACRKFWVAVYTRPRSEKKVAKVLEASGVEVYLPIQTQIRKWSDRKKKIEVPVIPMVVFVKVNECQIANISQHSLVIKFISRPGENKAACIPEIQINNLKFILGQSDIPVEFDSDPYKINDSVEVIRGYFKGLKGEIHDCPDGTTDLIVRIDLLGGAKLKINKQDLIHI